MPVKNAIELLKIIDVDKDFRTALNKCKNLDEVSMCLNSRQLNFSPSELDEAVDFLHSKCQTYEVADQLLSKADWIKYLLFSTAKQ